MASLFSERDLVNGLEDALKRIRQDLLFFYADYYGVVAGLRDKALPGGAAALELLSALVKHWGEEGPPSTAWDTIAEQLGPTIPVPVRYLRPLVDGWDKQVTEGGNLRDNLNLQESPSKQGSHWREKVKEARERFILAFLFEFKRESWATEGKTLSIAKAADELSNWLNAIGYWERRGLPEPDPAAEEIERAHRKFGKEARALLKLIAQ